MDIAIPVLLKPLFFLAVLLVAALLARSLRPWIPAGRVKDALYRKHAVIPRNEAERRDWTGEVALWVAAIVPLVWMAWLGRDVI